MLALDDLDPAEQRQLYDQLAYRFSKQTQTFSADEIELWDAICDVLNLGKRERMPLKSYVQQHGRTKYGDQVTVVELLIARSVPEMIRRTVKSAVRRRMLACLAKWLRSRDLPVTPTIMTQNLGMLEHAVNACYPGYISARLLHRIAPLAEAGI